MSNKVLNNYGFEQAFIGYCNSNSLNFRTSNNTSSFYSDKGHRLSDHSKKGVSYSNSYIDDGFKITPYFLFDEKGAVLYKTFTKEKVWIDPLTIPLTPTEIKFVNDFIKENFETISLNKDENFSLFAALNIWQMFPNKRSRGNYNRIVEKTNTQTP